MSDRFQEIPAGHKITEDDINGLLSVSGAKAVIVAVESCDAETRDRLIDSSENSYVATARRMAGVPKAPPGAPPTEGIVRIMQENIKFSKYIARAKGAAANPLLEAYINQASGLMSAHGIEPAALPAGIDAAVKQRKLREFGAQRRIQMTGKNNKPGL